MRRIGCLKIPKSRFSRTEYLLHGILLIFPLITPLVLSVSTASASETVSENAISATYRYPSEITTANGSLWYIEWSSTGNYDYIASMTSSGTTADYHVLPSWATSMPIAHITTGSDGNVWFDGCAYGGTTSKLEVGNVNTATGAVTFYPNSTLGTCSQGGGEWTPGPIAVGPDGNVWYSAVTGGAFSSYIFSVSSSGTQTVAWSGSSSERYDGMATGSDGRLWVTDRLHDKVYAYAGTAGSMTKTTYNVPTTGADPENIISGPDGNLWFIESSGNPYKIAKVTTSGSFTEYSLPTGTAPVYLAAGPDGAIWFTDEHSGGDKIGRITTSGSVTGYSVPTSSGGVVGITLGPDDAMWFTEMTAGKVGRIGY